MNGMDDATEVFVAKVDAFAATLEPEEQAMLIDLLVGDDNDVTGFAAGWPGLLSLGIASTARGSPDGFEQSGGASPTIFKTEPNYSGSGYMQSGGVTRV